MKTATNATPELTALLEHQQAIGSVSSTIANLEGAIADYTTTAGQMHAKLPDPGAAEQERENLLAAIAVGEKGQADLEALDARVAKQLAQRQQEQRAVTGIEQTIAGLQRRLRDEQGKQQQLFQAHADLMRRFLLAEAEAEGVQYASMGVALAASYRRLRALDALLAAHGRSMPIRTHGPELHVPAFDLESVKPHAPPPLQGADYVGSIYDQRWHARETRLAEIEREKVAFRALGLEIE